MSNNQFDRIRAKEWPDDLKVSKDTLEAAEFLWEEMLKVSDLALAPPNISPAPENSIDFFWGDKERRLLVNVPDISKSDLIFLHHIYGARIMTASFDPYHVRHLIAMIRSLGYI